MPLVWLRTSWSVTVDHARGRVGSHFPTVSVRARAPSAAADSATAPLNALATLASLRRRPANRAGFTCTMRLGHMCDICELGGVYPIESSVAMADGAARSIMRAWTEPP